MGVMTSVTSLRYFGIWPLLVEQVRAVGVSRSMNCCGLGHHGLALGAARRRAAPRRAAEQPDEGAGGGEQGDHEHAEQDEPERRGSAVPAARRRGRRRRIAGRRVTPACRQGLEEQPLPRILSQGCGCHPAGRAKVRGSPASPQVTFRGRVVRRHDRRAVGRAGAVHVLRATGVALRRRLGAVGGHVHRPVAAVLRAAPGVVRSRGCRPAGSGSGSCRSGRRTARCPATSRPR